jgi:hypothetical protein
MKFKDYQNRLNILLSQPEILKKMNDHYVKRNSVESIDNNINYARKLKKEQKKNQIKMKVNYMTQLNNFDNSNDVIKKIMEAIEEPNELNIEVVNSLVNNDIHKQENNFKARLEEKRKKRNSLQTEDLSIKRKSNDEITLIGDINGNGTNNSISMNPNDYSKVEGEEVTKTKVSLTTPGKSLFTLEPVEEETASEKNTTLIKGNIADSYQNDEENSFEKMETDKLEELNNLVSPSKSEIKFKSDENGASDYNMGMTIIIDTSPKKNNKELITSMFELNENVTYLII